MLNFLFLPAFKTRNGLVFGTMRFAVKKVTDQVVFIGTESLTLLNEETEIITVCNRLDHTKKTR